MATAPTRVESGESRFPKPLWTTKKVHTDCKVLASERGLKLTQLVTALLTEAVERERQGETQRSHV